MSSNDYFMRMIEGFTDMLSVVMFGRKSEDDDVTFEVHNNTEEHTLLIDLRFLVAQGKLGEAENLLFQRMEGNDDTNYHVVAGTFYSWLDRMSDEELDRNGFPREEIAVGRQAVAAYYSK